MGSVPGWCGLRRRRFRRMSALLTVGLAFPLAVAVSVEATVTYMCGGREATIVGSPGKDNIGGTPDDDVIVGLGGNDKIRGEGGNDVICGGPGNDDINGGDGADRVLGDEGNDSLQGGNGDDVIEGGDGNDDIKGGDGDDVLLGQGGNKNSLVGGNGFDSCDSGSGGSVTQCENFPPTAVDDSYTTDEDTPLNVPAPGVLANDSDPDGNPLSVVSVDDSATLGTVVVSADGSFSYDPSGLFEALAAGESATDSFTYEVSDGILGASATVTITVTGVNDPPTANDDGGSGFGTDEDTSFATGSVLGNDTDPDASDVLSVLSIDTTGTAGVVSDNGDGTFDYDPNGQFQSLAVGESAIDTFDYTVSDGNGGTDTARVTITISGVNDPPDAVDDFGAEFTTDEDTWFDTGNVLSNDTDPDTSDSIVVVSVDASSTLGIVVNNLDGTFGYDPDGQFEALNDGDTAIDTFTYTISDGNGGFDTATVTVTVSGVTDNFPPDAVDDDVTTDEDTVLNGNVLADNGNGADSDPDGDTFTVTAVNGSALDVGVQFTLPSGASLTQNSDGSFTYGPDASFEDLGTGDEATDSYTYTITDSPFGATDTATVTVTITGVDDAPVAVDDDATVAEEAAATSIDVLANDTDVDGGPKTIASASDPANGTVVVAGDNLSVTYQPDANYCNDGSPTDNFTYVLNGGASATVRVTVNCDDDPPVAVDDSATVAEDDPATAIDVLANDTDVDGGPMTIDSVTQPPDGAVVITDGGTGLTYQPDPNYCNDAGQSDDFTYTLVPGGSTATVAVTVTCVDDPPVAVDDSATVTEDDSATAINVLANDTDVDGGPMTIVSVTQPTNGAVAITGGGTGLTYQPDPNYCNDSGPTDDFTYTLSPGGDTATVAVTVTCVPEPPVAVDDVYSGLPVNVLLDAGGVTASGVEVNDADGVLTKGTDDSDPEGGVLSVTGIVGCSDVAAPFTDCATTGGGLVTMNSNGTFTYISELGETAGSDTFTYTLSNGSLTDTGTVTINLGATIWFIDNGVSGGANDGRSNSPFESIGSFNAATTDPGDTVFVHSGTYTDAGIDLSATQVLVGERSGLTSGNLTIPAGTAPVLAPTAGNAIDLSSGNTVRGLDIGSTASTSSTGIFGTAVGALTISDVGISGTGGGVDLASPAGSTIAVTLNGLSASSSTDEGIRLNNVNGTFTVTASNGVIATTGVPAVDIDGGATSLTVNATFAAVSVNGGSNGILLTDVSAGDVHHERWVDLGCHGQRRRSRQRRHDGEHRFVDQQQRWSHGRGDRLVGDDCVLGGDRRQRTGNQSGDQPWWQFHLQRRAGARHRCEHRVFRNGRRHGRRHRSVEHGHHHDRHGRQRDERRDRRVRASRSGRSRPTGRRTASC